MTNSQPAPSAIEGERDHLEKGLTALLGVIDNYSGDGDVVKKDSSVHELKQIARSVADDTKEMLHDARLLRLGIVGQVKAGKSSLLNMLLFEGQEVLPKAATPMTASLTHIVKSDRDEIEVEYYSLEDWESIRKHAGEYRRRKAQGSTGKIEPFLEAGHQIIEMARTKGIHVQDYLGKTHVLDVSEERPGGLNEEMRRLVGSSGELTPLVKSVTLRSSEGMPELDIVDTPGINDPIASRSLQTKKMLRRCDAVLLLSRTSQFMDAQDVAFFEREIPKEGIEHRVVIGSQFDSVLVDASRDHRGLLDEAMLETERRLTPRADIATAGGDVVLMSAMCAALAKKPADSWTPDERHAFDTLQRAYPDYLDQPEAEGGINQSTREQLVSIGNRTAVDDVLNTVRTEKDVIIVNKMTAFIREKRAQALDELDELVGDLEKRRSAVETGDVNDIVYQQRSIDTLRGKLEANVTRRWDDLIEGQGKYIDQLREDLRELTEQARDKIKGAVGTEVKTKKKKKKGAFPALGRMVGIGGYESRTYEKKVLDQAELETTIHQFYEEIEGGVASIVEEMYNKPFANATAEVLCREVALSFSDDLAAPINEDLLKRSLREAVRQIVREADKRLKNVRDSLFGTIDFSFRYEGYSVKGGQRKGREVVKEVRDKAIKWLDLCEQQIDAVQERAKADLVPATVSELEDYQERLKKEVADKRFTLQRYGLVLDELAQVRQRLEAVAGTIGG